MIYDTHKLYYCGYVLFIPIVICRCFYSVVELFDKYNNYILKKALI